MAPGLRVRLWPRDLRRIPRSIFQRTPAASEPAAGKFKGGNVRHSRCLARIGWNGEDQPMGLRLPWRHNRLEDEIQIISRDPQRSKPRLNVFDSGHPIPHRCDCREHTISGEKPM